MAKPAPELLHHMHIHIEPALETAKEAANSNIVPTWSHSLSTERYLTGTARIYHW